MGDSPLICDRGLICDSRRALFYERRTGVYGASPQTIEMDAVLTRCSGGTP